MAPLRRRVSRRVVKSTFQECFEYDIPRPKNSVLRQPAVLPVGRPKRSVDAIRKKKLELRRPTVSKAKTKLSKGIAKLAVTRAAETLNKKGKEIIKTRRQIKTESESREAQNLTSDSKKSSSLKLKNTAIKKKKKVSKEDGSQELCRAIKSEAAFDSEEWQPVVNLEKISVDSKKRSIGNGEAKAAGTRKQTRSLSLGSTWKKIESDESLGLTSDNESEKESSSNISLGEEFKGLEDSSVSTSSEDLEGNDTGFEELNKSESSVLESSNSKSSINNPSNDSAREDWPEDSSDTSHIPVPAFGVGSDSDNISSQNNGFGHDWSSSHVSQLFHLQEHFHFITNDLRNSFESLKTIIEDKNMVIESFKTKLESFTGNEYHQMLEKILHMYDVNDPENPATEVVKVLKKFSETENSWEIVQEINEDGKDYTIKSFLHTYIFKYT